LALKAGSCLRRLADIVCLLARFSAGILEGRIYLSQLSKFRGPPHNQPANLPHDTSFASVIIHINVNQLDLSLIIL
jgi:hypothetical protein